MFALAVGLMVGSGNTSGEISATSTEQVYQVKAPLIYDMFIEGCYDGFNYEYCDCSYKRLEEQYGPDRIVEIGLVLDSGNAGSEQAKKQLLDVAESCR